MDASCGGDKQTSRTDMAATIIPKPTIPNTATGLLNSHSPGVFVAVLLVAIAGIGISADKYVFTSIGMTSAAALGVTAEMDCGHMAQHVPISSTCRRLNPSFGFITNSIPSLV